MDPTSTFADNDHREGVAGQTEEEEAGRRHVLPFDLRLPRIALYQKRYLVLLWWPAQTTDETITATTTTTARTTIRQVPALRLDQVARFVVCQSTTTTTSPHTKENHDQTSDKNEDMPNNSATPVFVNHEFEFEYLTLTIPSSCLDVAGNVEEQQDLFLFPYQNHHEQTTTTTHNDHDAVVVTNHGRMIQQMEAFVDPAASSPLVVQARQPHDICIRTHHDSFHPHSQSLLLHVTDTGGCWVGDFLRIGGLHQIWILPRLIRMTATTATTTGGPPNQMNPALSRDEAIDHESAKRLLQQIVQHSIWTDGVHIYPSSLDHSVSHNSSCTTPTSQRIHDIVIQSPRICSTRMTSPIVAKNRRTATVAAASTTGVVAHNGLGGSSSLWNRTRSRRPTTIKDDPKKDNDSSHHWSHKVVHGLEAQWRHSQEARASRERATAQQEGWIRTSRSMLHRMTHPHVPCSSDRPENGGSIELVRLRYSTRPNHHPPTMGTTTGSGGGEPLGLSCVVCMEVDIVYRHSSSSSRGGGGGEATTNHHEMDSTSTTVPPSSTTNHGNDGNKDGDHRGAASTEHRQAQRKQESDHVNEYGRIGMAQQVHVSCAFANPNQENHLTHTGGGTNNKQYNHNGTTNQVVVRTQSGVVPHLVPDTCVTIVVLVDVNHIPVVSSSSTKTKPHDPADETNDSFPIALAIHAMWTTTNSSSLQQSLSHDEEERNHSKRVGMPLAILYLPLEVTILQHSHNHFVIDYTTVPSQEQEPQSGPCRRRRRVVTNSSMKSRAMYECRHPRVLTLDISNVPGRDDRRQEQQWWKQVLVTSLNRASTTNRIDVQYDDHHQDQQIIKLLLFSCTPQERLAFLKIVLGQLPDAARLIVDKEAHDDDSEDYLFSELAVSLQKEASAMARHRSSKSISLQHVKEMVKLQIASDTLVSQIQT